MHLNPSDTIAIGRELSAQIFYQQPAGNGYALPNQRQLQLLLTCNVLKDLQRTGGAAFRPARSSRN